MLSAILAAPITPRATRPNTPRIATASGCAGTGHMVADDSLAAEPRVATIVSAMTSFLMIGCMGPPSPTAVVARSSLAGSKGRTFGPPGTSIGAVPAKARPFRESGDLESKVASTPVQSGGRLHVPPVHMGAEPPKAVALP